jgi:hypothetical protein
MVDKAYSKDRNAFLEQRVNPLLVSLFKAQLKNIDPLALGNNSLWEQLADNCSLHYKNV